MTIAVRFVEEASLEMTETIDWYERAAARGRDFLEAVDDVTDRIRRWPQLGTVDSIRGRHEIRRIRVAAYPYSLAYIVFDERIEVLAVAHDRLRPMYWRDRVPE